MGAFVSCAREAFDLRDEESEAARQAEFQRSLHTAAIHLKSRDDRIQTKLKPIVQNASLSPDEKRQIVALVQRRPYSSGLLSTDPNSMEHYHNTVKEADVGDDEPTATAPRLSGSNQTPDAITIPCGESESDEMTPTPQNLNCAKTFEPVRMSAPGGWGEESLCRVDAEEGSQAHLDTSLRGFCVPSSPSALKYSQRSTGSGRLHASTNVSFASPTKSVRFSEEKITVMFVDSEIDQTGTDCEGPVVNHPNIPSEWFDEKSDTI